MKRFLAILIVAIMLCGVGYLGYLIFLSKNIQTVEIVGNVQTIYIAGDDLDLQDAKLKITYKNGNIKMVDITDKNVDIANFSADTVKNDGKMILSYKSFKFEIDYDVIEKGSWYLSKMTSKTSLSQYTTEYTEDGKNDSIQTTKFVYLDSNGVLQYYVRDESKWLMYDGRVDKDYNYTIKDDTIFVNLDGEVYEMKSAYDTKGYMNIVSTKLTRDSVDPDIITKKEELEFKPSQLLIELKYRTALSVELDDYSYNSADITTVSIGGTDYDNVVRFKRGENLNSAAKRSTNKIKLFLKVTYIDTFMSEVYVNICDEMIRVNTFVTKEVTNFDYFLVTYEGKPSISIRYLVYA